MKKLISAIVSIAIVAALLLGATGCVPRQGTPTPGSTATPGTQVTQGGTLNLSGTDPLTLDPAVAADMGSQEFIVQIFSGLVRPDADLKPAPDIADSWKISPDGKTYTFTLKQTVKFQDGREVKAADFKYSWERACAPSTDSRTAATYLGDIVGVSDVISGNTQTISGVKVIDDYTLEVKIDAPRPYFLSKLTYSTAFVVDSNNVKPGEWWRTPNGTGPFKLRQWQQYQSLVLEKNSLYYGQVANVDAVAYQFYTGTPIDLYELNKIDVGSISVDYIYRVTDEASPFHSQLTTMPELSFYYIGFNTTKPPFDDANVRQAFTMAVDKNKLVSLAFNDMMQPAYGIVPPGMPGYNDNPAGLKFDVGKAKDLIKNSKYGDVSKLPSITLTTIGQGGAIAQTLEGIINEWRQNLGVEVQVRQLEPERFLYHLKEEKDEMYDMGWIADYPHPQDFLDILFHSGADNNYGEYSNSAVDALLDRAGVEPDTARSLQLYQQAEQQLINDAACLPLWFGKNYLLTKPYVKGYDLNPQGLVMLNSVYIEPH